jgi:hypothetical protein
MESGVGLAVIRKSGYTESLFTFTFYNTYTKTQYLNCYYYLWVKYYKDIKAMYIPLTYGGVQQVIKLADFRI